MEKTDTLRLNLTRERKQKEPGLTSKCNYNVVALGSIIQVLACTIFFIFA